MQRRQFLLVAGLLGGQLIGVAAAAPRSASTGRGGRICLIREESNGSISGVPVWVTLGKKVFTLASGDQTCVARPAGKVVIRATGKIPWMEQPASSDPLTVDVRPGDSLDVYVGPSRKSESSDGYDTWLVKLNQRVERMGNPPAMR